jgi:hypothetical protein
VTRTRRPRHFFANERGLSTLEYALIFIVILVGALMLWRKLGDSLDARVGQGTRKLEDTLNGERQEATGASTAPAAASGSQTAATSGNQTTTAAPSSNPSQPSAASTPPATSEPQPEPSFWDKARDTVVQSSAVQMGLGIAYGTVEALAPGGFIAPSPAPYAPSTNKPRNIWSEINDNKVNPANKPRQTDRIVLNLNDSAVELGALKKQFNDWPIDGLKEVIVVKGGQIIHFWP